MHAKNNIQLNWKFFGTSQLRFYPFWLNRAHLPFSSIFAD